MHSTGLDLHHLANAPMGDVAAALGEAPPPPATCPRCSHPAALTGSARDVFGFTVAVCAQCDDGEAK